METNAACKHLETGESGSAALTTSSEGSTSRSPSIRRRPMRCRCVDREANRRRERVETTNVEETDNSSSLSRAVDGARTRRFDRVHPHQVFHHRREQLLVGVSRRDVRLAQRRRVRRRMESEQEATSLSPREMQLPVVDVPRGGARGVHRRQEESRVHRAQPSGDGGGIFRGGVGALRVFSRSARPSTEEARTRGQLFQFGVHPKEIRLAAAAATAPAARSDRTVRGIVLPFGMNRRESQRSACDAY